MMRYLFIAEKPSLMKEVEKCYKNNSAAVRAAVGDIEFTALSGHVCEYYAPDDYEKWADEKWGDLTYPIVPETWGIKGKPDKADIIKRVKASVKGCDGIIVGTDSDTEGYGIYWLLEHFLHMEGKKTLRFMEHSLTEKEILDSLLSMTDYHMDPVHTASVNAWLLRSRADWLFGMNCTRIMTCKKGTLMRIGRVKTATLAIVYDNSTAIENFKPEKYYTVQADYGGFRSALLDGSGKTARFKEAPDCGRFPAEGTVKKKTTKRTYERAPQLFDLTVAQAEAGRVYGYTPDHTLDVIQSLYEKHKVISYPRTQCSYVSSEKAKEFGMMLSHMSAFPDLGKIAAGITPGDISRVMEDPKVVNDAEVSKESHDALLPTSKRADPSVMTEDERNICHMIYARLLSQFLPQAAVDKTDLVISHGDGDFAAHGRTVAEQGWRVLFGKAKDAFIPDIEEGDTVVAKSIRPAEGKTTPPKRLTMATLIYAMKNIASLVKDAELRKSLAESKGIGTPATRAAIIKDLAASRYMENKKDGLYITPLGRNYIESLEGIDIVSPVFAARLDMEMKKVQRREEEYGEAYGYVLSELGRVCQLMEAKEASPYGEGPAGAKCPVCGAELMVRKFSYACADPGCSFKVSRKIAGKEITRDILLTLLKEGATPPYPFVSKAGKAFKARLLLGADGNITFDFSSGLKCPVCHGDGLDINRGGAFCKCGFKLYRKICGHELTDGQIKTLVTKGKTSVIDGFTSKAGKSFSARLVLDGDGKASFSFQDMGKKQRPTR